MNGSGPAEKSTTLPQHAAAGVNWPCRCVAADLFLAPAAQQASLARRPFPPFSPTELLASAPPKSSSFIIDTATSDCQHHAAAMGVQKKTRKFAQVKRVIGTTIRT
jgi:hypothetical protein